MLIKCGREEFELNEDDEIMHNGYCWQIMTRTAGHGWNTFHPIVAKNKADKLLREGILYFHHNSTQYKGCKIYKIKESI